MDRGNWTGATELLLEADREVGLDEGSLDLLAGAAYPAGRKDLALEARERLHALHLRRGDRVGAAAEAGIVAMLMLDTMRMTPVQAWIKRALRLLEGEPESLTHAWLEMTQAYAAMVVGDLDGTLDHAKALVEMATRLGDAGYQAIGRNAEARALILRGEVERGLALLDEAALAALSGELDPLRTAILYCSTICACQAVGDLRRAEEWTDAMERWRRDQPVGAFHGRCRVHRAELLRIRGSWPEAEDEAQRARDELQPYATVEVGWPLSELGQLRLRRGDFEGAEEAFVQAHEAGWEPQPGLSLLRLATGDIGGAAASIRLALDDPAQFESIERPPNTELRRGPLLAAQVEIAIASGDLDRARWAAGQLKGIASTFGTPALRAAAAVADGSVRLAEGDAGAARISFQQSLALWRDVQAPYETARARVSLASAQAALGNAEAALLELRAARSAFDRLGAVPDARRAAKEIAAIAPGPEKAEGSLRRAFMFTDIVRSTDLIEAIGDDAWGHLVSWHNQTLALLIAEHAGQVVNTTGDGFFAVFAGPRPALDCAVAIQRALDVNRREHGFAPQVRIGIHLTDATRQGADWRGRGVHIAARIAALAQGGEILASVDAAQASSGVFLISEPRSVRLKGIANAVDVVVIAWR
jgi:class 3 adenylate cyclase